MATAAAVRSAPIDGAMYQPPTRQRVDSIDLLRGLVMVIMMLDHTRDFFSHDQYLYDPTDLTKTHVALFLTRWITHFCAPTFFFLAGTGAFLRRQRGATPGEMTSFLVSRGIWLIVLELTVVRIGLTFNVNYHGFTYGQTIWALGWSMIVLGLLVHLPLWVTGAFGVVMIAVHNAFDGIKVPAWSPGMPDLALSQKLTLVLHQPGSLSVGGASGTVFMTFYPLVPWIGVMAGGYAFGQLYTMDAPLRRRQLVRLGGALVMLFVLLRASNLYGDASKWTVQSSGAFTVLSFVNVTKYPPSLLYLCMTLGPAILFLAVAERARRGRIGAALVTLGRVPMLFYLLQWFAAHLMALALFKVAGQPTDVLFIDLSKQVPADIIARSGFSLPVVYLFWIIGVLLIYPLCAWFAAVKRRRNDWWLGYL
ncbi:MAG: heparan-alpha-glucosaminide N-acetyltransferase domain-containing protein [Gemmatimonadaceae bacterium]